MKSLETDILKTLHRAVMIVKSTGSEREGHILLNKGLIGYCSLHYGTLAALLNDPSIKPENDMALYQWVIKRDDSAYTKHSLDEIENAVQILILNGHVTDSAETKWLDMNSREIKMTQAGYGALISNYYIKEKEKELTAKTTNNLSKASAFIALAALVISGLQLFKSDEVSIPQLKPIEIEMQKLRQDLLQQPKEPQKQTPPHAINDSTTKP